MSKTVYIRTALLSFLIGLGLTPFLKTNLNFIFSIGILCFVLFFLVQKSKQLQLFFWGFFFLIIALLRTHFNQHFSTTQHLDFYNDQKIKLTLTGIICDEPDIGTQSTKYTFCTQFLFSQPLTGKVLLTTRRYPLFEYGDQIQIKGQIKSPPNFEDFNYAHYLARYNIFSLSSFPEIKLLQKNQGNPFLQKLYSFKKTVEQTINQLLPEPNSSFLAGLLIGTRHCIPDNILENFNLTGLTHIIAISGYNITIIILFISRLFSFLPRQIGSLLAIFSVMIFTIFVGASAAVVRAAIMGILGLIALQKGRQTDSLILVLLTAVLMTFYNPKILWYDSGFQLSFLAILGILYVAPLFDKLFSKITTTFAIRESLQITLSAQITAVPLILLNFNRLSLIAPLSNLLVAPLIPLAMFFGFLSLLFNLINFKIALLSGFITNLILSVILKIASFLGSLPYASLEIKQTSLPYVLFYYVVLFVFLWKKHAQKITPN